MANNIWDKFDKEIDTEALAKDIGSANTGSFRQVPHGNYEVSVSKMELVASKAGDPMVSIWFKVVNGEYKGSLIFYNQVIKQGFQVHLVNEMLRKMDSGLDVEFVSYKQYGNRLMDIHEAIDNKLEYELAYKEGKNSFSTFDIVEVFDVK